MSISRILKLSTFTGIGFYTGYVFHQNDWNYKDIGIIRFATAVSQVGQIAIDYKYSVSHLKDSSPETLEKWSQCHQRAADRLLKLCCKNGGVFIKVGQHIAALDYLVPKEYSDTLKVLHNQAPRSSIAEIKDAIKKELGKNMEEIFDEFDEQAIASASLAQVHRARLKDTKDIVAVKVQHPKVFRHVAVDIATMDFLSRIMIKIFPDFSFKWLLDETKRNIPLELDFVNEGKNSEKIAILLKEFLWLKIPKVYWNLTTKRVLMMEYIDGALITDKEYFKDKKINTKEIVNRFEKIYGKMIYTWGNIHCDPHPGNILIKAEDNDFKLCLIDHGLYSQLTDEFRQNYCEMCLAIFNGNMDDIKRTGQYFGVTEKDAPLLSCIISAKPISAITRGLKNRPNNKEAIQIENKELRLKASEYMNSITRILGKMDRQLLLVLKTNDLVRFICNAIGQDERRSLLNMSRFCVDTVGERRLNKSNNFLQRLFIHFQIQCQHFKLSFYSFFLWVDSLFA